MPTPRRSRAENRLHMEAEILRLGRAQLTDRGPAQLSVRQIARDLGVASSAVYRYVADRDALLTLLLVDAYTDLADAVDAAVAAAPDTAVARLFAVGDTLRAWALDHPSSWGLVYGTPVPGYTAPPERTTGPGTRLMATLALVIASLPPRATAGTPADTEAADGPEPTGPYAEYLTAGAAALGVDAEPVVMADAVQAWCAIVGTISMEVFGQLGPEANDVGESILHRTLGTILAGRV